MLHEKTGVWDSGISSDLSIEKITGKVRKADLSTVYVAMSRLKRHTQGSHLTVVCSNPKLRDFGTTWPSFAERSLTKLEAPEEIPF